MELKKTNENEVASEEKMEGYVVTKKINLVVVNGDGTECKDKSHVNAIYSYIRNGQELYARWVNRCMSMLYGVEMRSDLTNEEKNAERKRIRTLCSRKPDADEPEYSAHPIDELELYPKGLSIGSYASRTAASLMDTSLKKGLKYGRVSLPTIRSSVALPFPKLYVSPMGAVIEGRNAGLWHDYADEVDFEKALKSSMSVNLFMTFVLNKAIFGDDGCVFKFVFKNPRKSHELRTTMYRLMSGEYRACDSAIKIDEKSGKLVLLLTLWMPKKVVDVDASIVCGVHFGGDVPVVAALSSNEFTREKIGKWNDFQLPSLEISDSRRELQTYLRYNLGGHGRKKKLKKLECFHVRQRNFTRTYNHLLSKNIVDFAIANRAGVIQVSAEEENAEGNSFELRNYIKYKAESNGIEYREVLTENVLSTCSCCGHVKVEAESTAEEAGLSKYFTCGDKNCRSHTIYVAKGKRPAGSLDAGFNAARNIALYVGEEKKKAKKAKKLKQEEK